MLTAREAWAVAVTVLIGLAALLMVVRNLPVIWERIFA
jgi:hypothetical protein